MKTRTFILSVVFFITAVLLAGCATTRKLKSNIQETTKVEEKRTEVVTGEVTTFVDTTKKEGLEITYTKIEFYPPVSDLYTEIPNDEENGVVGGAEEVIGKEPFPKAKEPPNKRGAVKSIEKYTVKQNKETAGTTKAEEKTQATSTEEIVTDISTDEVITEAPAPDPYRWRYILAIIIIVLVAGTAVCFWLRKTKVITTIVSLIKKLFVRN